MKNEYTQQYLTTPEELSAYRELFLRNGSEKNMDQLMWIHFKNPASSSKILQTFDKNNELVAIIATINLVFKVGNTTQLACQTIDLLTDSEHYGQGLFKTAGTTLYQKLEEEKYAFTYAFPNDKSVHGFTNKLDWELLDPMPFIIKPLRSGFFAKKIVGQKLGSLFDIGLFRKKTPRLPKNATIKKIERFDDDATLLWNSFSSQIDVAVQRDAKYLNWRYFEKPNEDYKIYGYYDQEVLVGFVVFAIKEKHGGSVGYIMELLYHREEESVGAQLLRLATNKMIDKKTDVCLAWCFKHAPNYRAFKKQRFMTFIEKLRPITLHIGFRSLSITTPLIKKRENWYISYSDSDTV